MSRNTYREVNGPQPRIANKILNFREAAAGLNALATIIVCDQARSTVSVLELRMFFRRKTKDKEVAAPQPLPPPIPVMTPTGEADFRALGRALWRKKLRILAFTVIAAAAAFISALNVVR